jgi:hypothetical protein
MDIIVLDTRIKLIVSPKSNGDIAPKGRFSNVPALRTLLYGTEWQRYRNSIRRQCFERGPIPDSAWGTQERCEIVRKIRAILKEECWGEDFEFHPDDRYAIVGEFEIGDLSEIEALAEIENQFGIKIDEDMREILGDDATFGEFVDYIIKLISGNKIKRTD